MNDYLNSSQKHAAKEIFQNIKVYLEDVINDEDANESIYTEAERIIELIDAEDWLMAASTLAEAWYDDFRESDGEARAPKEVYDSLVQYMSFLEAVGEEDDTYGTIIDDINFNLDEIE
ncbi:hypothetical protein JKG47_19625 [Acidithiobacillus sp. MC6.1]|nr:hypothetical protein [Acidithiobacillus sp. MC6.1]